MTQERVLIFHIIHGSFVDGYGIRTTVFLKGCPLRCLWCCNPEGQAYHPELKVTPSLCDGCGRCIPACPAGAISLGGDGLSIDRGLCTNCGQCPDVCYTGALDCFGTYMTVDEVFDIVKKDEPYYRTSGGGVTIGGGEPTAQPHFTLALLRKCRGNYIHTAVDTCGYTLTDEGFRVLEEADLLLFDLKGLDMAKHIINTGVTNEPILSNLKRLDAIGKPIIIRLPVIPGYNDSDQDIASAAAFLTGLKSVERVDILTYHAYGSLKYRQLGRDYNLDLQPPVRERVNEIIRILEGHGLKAQLGG